MKIRTIIGTPERVKDFNFSPCSCCGKAGGWWRVKVREERFKKARRVSEAIVTLRVCSECVQMGARELLKGWGKGGREDD
jgi:hypothetical protein